MAKDIIVNFCPTGMVPTKDMSPHVPISASEIIEQTHEAYEIGITIAHLHARDKDGKPTYKKSSYKKIVDGVRNHCPDLIICLSTSGRNVPEFEKRSEVIELQPDMCSLTLSSLNFTGQASVNSPEMVGKLAEKMKKFGVIPELECFGLGMINYGKYLIKKEIIEEPFYWNLLYGNIAGMQADLNHVGASLNDIPDSHFISLGGLGGNQLKINSLAIALGYGVRVGLEDNLWWDAKRKKLCKNIDLVKRIHRLIEINDKTFFEPKKLGQLGFYNKKRFNE
jgi:uncharacterized protein (DUF849 family)